MRSYDLIEDYFGRGQGQAGQNIPDVVTTTPEWVIAVIRLRHPITYRRKDKASFSTFFPDAVDTRGATLIIRDDCVSISTSSQKGNHLSQFSATLVPGQNYLSNILPGDYVIAWMLNEKERAEDLVQRIRDGKACNRFKDGLKFFGRCHALRKQLQQDPGGTRITRYLLTGVGFSEFDATFYYNPHLAENIPAIGRWFGRIASSFNQLVDDGKYIDVNKAIPFFVDLLLGRGVPESLGRGNSDPALKSSAGVEAPYSYIVPTSVGTLIGKTVSSKEGGALAYADMLELIGGVWTFDNTPGETASAQASDSDSQDAQDAAIFTPDGPAGGSRRITSNKMLGRFLPQIPQFENTTVWSILSQYLNPACNEMFTALRTNGDGNVVPTLVVRQLPFSSGLVNPPFAITRFLDLPRWRIHPAMVTGADIGRSDTMRFNFVHVLGVAPTPVGKNDLTGQTVRNPPFRDDLDIARNGLRNYSTTVPCAFEDIKVKTGTGGSTAASNWMELISDILMGQHLALNGTMTLVGVQAPICIGDNVEWDGVAFHIEGLTHTGQLQPDGKKTFYTVLQLSHGMRINPGQDDITLYAGIKQLDQTAFDAPAITDVALDPKNENEDAPNTGDVKAQRDAEFADKTAEANGPVSPTDASSIFGSIR